MDWPQGDQTAQPTPAGTPVLAVHESHEAGTPVTTLATWELICWPYNFQTIDDLGTNCSAEW